MFGSFAESVAIDRSSFHWISRFFLSSTLPAPPLVSFYPVSTSKKMSLIAFAIILSTFLSNFIRSRFLSTNLFMLLSVIVYFVRRHFPIVTMRRMTFNFFFFLFWKALLVEKTLFFSKRGLEISGFRTMHMGSSSKTGQPFLFYTREKKIVAFAENLIALDFWI